MLIWAVGLASAVNGDVLDFLDRLTTQYTLPIGGLLIAIAAGWVLTREDRESGFASMARLGPSLAMLWTVTIRFITPVLVLLVILWKVELLKPLID